MHGCTGCAGVAASSVSDSPRRGAASGARRLPALSRKGGPGFAAPSLGLATKVPRSLKCAHVVAFAPFVMGALGIRKADASSRTCSTVRSAIQASMVGVRAVRSRKSDWSSIHSGCPTSTQKSSHCCPVPHPSPTSPSLAAPTPGVATNRLRRIGRPNWSLKVTG